MVSTASILTVGTLVSHQSTGERSSARRVSNDLSVELVGSGGNGSQIGLDVGSRRSECSGDGNKENKEVGLELHGYWRGCFTESCGLWFCGNELTRTYPPFLYARKKVHFCL